MNKTDVLDALRLGLQKQKEDAVSQFKQELRGIDLKASLSLALSKGLTGFTLKRFPDAKTVEIELVKVALSEAGFDLTWFTIYSCESYIVVSLTRDFVKDVMGSEVPRVLNDPKQLVLHPKKVD